MRVTKGLSRQDATGKWWVEIGLPADAPTALLIYPVGGDLELAGFEREKPPTQTIAASGTAPPSWNPSTINQAPAGAIQVRRMAADPVFQDWSIRISSINPSSVADAESFALAYILNFCRAKVPADFTDNDVISRLNVLQETFARGGN